MNHYTTPQELIALHERLMNKNIEPGKPFITCWMGWDI